MGAGAVEETKCLLTLGDRLRLVLWSHMIAAHAPRTAQRNVPSVSLPRVSVEC